MMLSLAAAATLIIPTVRPSGFASLTSASATAPPAPGLLSMTTVLPSSRSSRSETLRSTMSNSPPGGPPTTIRTTGCGCACAAGHTASAKPSAANLPIHVLRPFIAASSCVPAAPAAARCLRRAARRAARAHPPLPLPGTLRRPGICAPPATNRFSPVTNDAPGAQNIATAQATSSGSPARPA